MFDHLSIGVTDLARSASFYDATLGALGFVRLNENARSVCYGRDGFDDEPPFAIIEIEDGERLSTPFFHLAFAASGRPQVDGFHRSAMRHGGKDDGAPGIREHYDPGYYAAFVLDPDGYRLEAVVHE